MIKKFNEHSSYDDDIRFGIRHRDGRPKKYIESRYDEAVDRAKYLGKKHPTHTFKVVSVIAKDDHRLYYAITSKPKII